MNRALLYARTLPTLRPVQVIGRLWRAVHSPEPDRSPAPPTREGLSWTPGPRREPSLVGRDRVRLSNRERDVADACAWTDESESKLWRYQLHYHDDLVAAHASDRAAWHDRWIGRWIQENPPGVGDGWEPYPLSVRIVRWVQFALSGGRLTPEAVRSLAVQTRFLRGSLEHHLLGNHLFANAKALVFAGLFFEGREAEGWLARGAGLVARELGEQVLSDGGHFERSPTYHALFLEDVLDLANLLGGAERALPARHADLSKRLAAVVPPMRRWLRAMTHPDGRIAFFNDACFGAAPEPEELEAYARRLEFGPSAVIGDGALVLTDSGYLRLAAGPAVLLCDIGELGPRYLMGHAHADTLSYELSLHGERWIVNSGTSVYGDGPERLRQRGTAAHNTIAVDGADSSEVWSGFRVARRAHPEPLALEEDGDALVARCAHDGYRRLPGRVRHERRWRLEPRALAVEDVLEGAFGEAHAALHLHPDVGVEGANETLRRGPFTARVAFEGGRVRCEDATWHPEFGRTVPNRCLRARFDGPRLTTRFAW